MIDGILVVVIVLASVYFVVKSLFFNKEEEAVCHGCDIKKEPSSPTVLKP